jgi:sulfite reductase (NADPH) hemoprotein beta-component
VGGEAVQDVEPLYGPTYLPRKFKIGIAIPPDNDVDIFTQDIGFIVVVDHSTNELLGLNVAVGKISFASNTCSKLRIEYVLKT